MRAEELRAIAWHAVLRAIYWAAALILLTTVARY